MGQSKIVLKDKLSRAKSELQFQISMNIQLKEQILYLKQYIEIIKARKNTSYSYMDMKDREIEKLKQIILKRDFKIQELIDNKFVIAKTSNRKRRIVVRP